MTTQVGQVLQGGNKKQKVEKGLKSVLIPKEAVNLRKKEEQIKRNPTPISKPATTNKGKVESSRPMTKEEGKKPMEVIENTHPHSIDNPDNIQPTMNTDEIMDLVPSSLLNGSAVDSVPQPNPKMPPPLIDKPPDIHASKSSSVGTLLEREGRSLRDNNQWSKVERHHSLSRDKRRSRSREAMEFSQ